MVLIRHLHQPTDRLTAEVQVVVHTEAQAHPLVTRYKNKLIITQKTMISIIVLLIRLVIRHRLAMALQVSVHSRMDLLVCQMVPIFHQ